MITTPLRPFHTPVRGHRFAVRPVAGAPIERSSLTLRREPDNPADPYAVAVWADGGGRPWRVGYLERAVAVRLAGRWWPDEVPRVRFAGWWEEPAGRWYRPVVRVGDRDDDGRPLVRGLRSLPPCSTIRRGDLTGTRRGRSASPGPAAAVR